jgi:Bacterial Ig domain
MFRPAMTLATLALAVSAVAVPPAFAGEEPDPTPAPAVQPTPTQPTPANPTPTNPQVLIGSAKLRTSQGCMAGNRAKASVSGSQIESVAFFVDGKKVKTLNTPNSGGSYTLTMSCAQLTFGTHRARAAVTFKTGVSPQQRTLVFQITRTRPVRPQFAG